MTTLKAKVEAPMRLREAHTPYRLDRLSAAKFKAQCLRLMDEVAGSGRELVITKRGKPVARLVPYRAKKRKSIFGCLEGIYRFDGDIVSPPLPPEAWETLKEWDELNK